MTILKISALRSGEPFDAREAIAFGQDLERQVGEVAPATERADGAKGPVIDIATLAIAVLSTPAITALIGVLKSWIERDDRSEFVVEGPAGKISLKSADKNLSHADMFAMIERVLSPSPSPE